MKPPHNCAVYQFSKHLELPINEVQEQMENLFTNLYPEETNFLSPQQWFWNGVRGDDPVISISPTNYTRSNYYRIATANLSHSPGMIGICGYSRTRSGAHPVLHAARVPLHPRSCRVQRKLTYLR